MITQKIRTMMSEVDRHIQKKFRLWFQKVDDEPTSKFFNVNYAVRQNERDTAQNDEFKFGIL